MSKVAEFNEYRSRMNEKIMAYDNKVVKRIYSVDALAYQEGGHLSVKTKELIGLTTSLVLRCDDCIKYHIGKCVEVGLSADEIVESMSIAMLVGGTIVIPHFRRAIEYLEEVVANPS